MGNIRTSLGPPQLKSGVGFLLASLVCFHVAYSVPRCGWLICGYPVLMVLAIPHLSARQAFYFGIGMGLLSFGPQLHFFHGIFQAAAVVLWLILSLWIAFFLLLGKLAIERFSLAVGCLLLPWLWTGLEYFRSELYYLRFSWMNTGYALSDTALAPALQAWGMYGVGWWLVGLGAVLLHGVGGNRWRWLAVWLAIGALPFLPVRPGRTETGSVEVAGMQLEESNPSDLIKHLDRLQAAFPRAELLVLHEYLLGGEPPSVLKQWCRQNRKWLVIGGKRNLPDDRWQNTAFVVGREGIVVFEQGKSVPIQFFDDGIPAPQQRVWNSPWGRLGIGICYDLSYTRVMDPLVRSGAQALLIPTMDAISWGTHQHGIHARVAPTRSREYGLGIFRVASSGISQLLSPSGETLATAPCPGQEAMLGGSLALVSGGRLPVDRWLAPLSVGVVGLQVMWLAIRAYAPRRKPNRPPSNARWACFTAWRRGNSTGP